jgi:hypothetical protein
VLQNLQDPSELLKMMYCLNPETWYWESVMVFAKTFSVMCQDAMEEIEKARQEELRLDPLRRSQRYQYDGRIKFLRSRCEETKNTLFEVKGTLQSQISVVRLQTI